MIIIEGPDGAGKSTLIESLLGEFPAIELHEKASTSTGGPVLNIERWTTSDIESWRVQPLSFYDRHPMFSETIYSHIVRKNQNKWFLSAEAEQLAKKMFTTGLIVFCLPKFEAVQKNVEVEEQLDGVSDNLYEIYETYKAWAMMLARKYPHFIFVYDYERNRDYGDLVKVIRAHEIKWNRRNEGLIA